MAYQNDPRLALSLLTRLPVKLPEAAYARSAQAAWAYPLVGVATGALAALVAAVALWLGLPAWATAICAIGAGLITTGAMHEDGLADCADGFWGGWDPAMRLKIMRDSQVGTYGVLTLLGTQALRFGAIWTLLAQGSWALPLIAVHVASRAAMPALMTALPHARQDGLSKSVGRVAAQSAIIAGLLGLAALMIAFGWAGVPLAGLVVLAAACVGALARHKIGGQTGDVCGALQQVAEITLLLALIV